VLFLAYANRYLAIAEKTRELHTLYNKTQSSFAKKQIESLKKRIGLIIAMQILAIMGIIACVLTIGLVLFGLQLLAIYTFLTGMLFIVISLLISVSELLISTQALNIELSNINIE